MNDECPWTIGESQGANVLPLLLRIKSRHTGNLLYPRHGPCSSTRHLSSTVIIIGQTTSLPRYDVSGTSG